MHHSIRAFEWIKSFCKTCDALISFCQSNYSYFLVIFIKWDSFKAVFRPRRIKILLFLVNLEIPKYLFFFLTANITLLVSALFLMHIHDSWVVNMEGRSWCWSVHLSHLPLSSTLCQLKEKALWWLICVLFVQLPDVIFNRLRSAVCPKNKRFEREGIEYFFCLFIVQKKCSSIGVCSSLLVKV